MSLQPINLLNTFFIVVLICSCKGKRDDVKEQESQSSPVKIAPTEVKFVEAKRKPFEYLINTSGKIESKREIALQFNVNGIISQVLVNNAQQVKQGDLLAAIANQKFELNAEGAEVQLRERKIVYQDQLMGFKGLSEDRLKLIEDNIHYSSGLAAAEVSYKQAKLEYENTFLNAPMNGVISDLKIKQGNSVKAGDVVCLIHDASELIVSCEILESDALSILIGHSASITLLSSPLSEFKATVSSINPRVDEKTGLVKIELALQSNGRIFIPGMSVNVTINIPRGKSVIVPKEAIVVRSGKQVVFTVDHGLAKWNYVVTGRENGKDIEVFQGLNENDKVIVSNNLQLADGTLIKESL